MMWPLALWGRKKQDISPIIPTVLLPLPLRGLEGEGVNQTSGGFSSRCFELPSDGPRYEKEWIKFINY